MTPARRTGTGTGGDHEAAGGRPVESLSYAQASAELDEIVEFFESGDVDVDQLVARLARAAAIIEELDRRLRGIRTQVEEIVPRLTTAAGGGDPGEVEPPPESSTASAPPQDGALF